MKGKGDPFFFTGENTPVFDRLGLITGSKNCWVGVVIPQGKFQLNLALSFHL